MTRRFVSKLGGPDQSYRELFRRVPDNPILTAKDCYPANSVFNPAATIYKGKVLLLARGGEERERFSHLTKLSVMTVSATGS